MGGKAVRALFALFSANREIERDWLVIIHIVIAIKSFDTVHINDHTATHTVAYQ